MPVRKAAKRGTQSDREKRMKWAMENLKPGKRFKFENVEYISMGRKSLPVRAPKSLHKLK